MKMTITLNEKGRAKLRALLDAHGKEGDSLDAWAREIEETLENRMDCESWCVELRGVKHFRGGTVDFEPDESDVDVDADMTVTNRRARLGNTALSAWVNEVGDQGDDETNLQDMLSDLIHLADAQGWNFHDLYEAATRNHNDEVIEFGKADASFTEGCMADEDRRQIASQWGEV